MVIRHIEQVFPDILFPDGRQARLGDGNSAG
jgi:hypothetical protein